MPLNVSYAAYCNPMRKQFVRAMLVMGASLALVMPLQAEDFRDIAAQAAAARNANKIPEAITLYKRALEIRPEWEEGWWFSGTLLYDSGHFAEARDAFQKLLNLNSQAAPAAAMLGVCEFETGDYERALVHIDIGLASPDIHNQQNIEQVLRYDKAALLTRIGQFDKAMAQYAWFAANNIKSDPVFAGIGLAALRNPIIPKDIRQGDLALYMTTGKVRYAMLAGDAPDADEGMRWLLHQFPQADNLHYLYGSFLMGSDPQKAIDQFRQELQLDPDNGAANALLAWTLLNWSESQQALQYAEKAVQLEPKDEVAQYVLGDALVSQNRIDAGLEHLKLAAQAEPDDARPHISLCTAFWKAGKPQDAKRERAVAIQLAKQSAAATGTGSSIVQ